MKKLVVILIVISGSAVFAQTNFYTNVTNLWYQGQISNVLTVATNRLTVNSNDIAGLVLKMECDVALLNLSAISNSILRVIQIGDTITTENFVKKFQIEREEMINDLELFKTYPTPNDLPTERAKAFIKNKEMPTYLFEALNKDGYFD